MKTRLAVALATATLALAGCGNGDSDSTAPDHNDADLAFATDMIPHHEQALRMVEMTEGRTLDPEFRRLTQAISAAQAPEIQTMTGWLEAWGESAPDDHGMNGMGDDDMDMGDTMPGMMSDRDLRSLESSPDSRFQDMWLTMMIEHHEGAIAMAETELADGEYPPALDLAGEIKDAQEAEIQTMRRLLAG